ncbi:uncharacterized protein [Lolium perenne]|jgi:hypothetical protein|uniref:uncharacterized protein n=1 Tax=Lolium perenne TaxID=4522 RepID=UPI0021F59DE3|nr:uncharacterized protein LOC127334287 [Lolium perenne]
MGRKACISLLMLLGVALALAGPATADMKAPYSIDAAVRELMSPPPSSSSSKLEDGVAPEFTADMEVHRRVLAGISPGSLNRNRQACLGSCPARGGSYTNRGCQSRFRCRG